MKIRNKKTGTSRATRSVRLFGSFPISDFPHSFGFRISDFGFSRLGGFTMVEIALCIAIIGFALVAIIGVLPAAMRVQQDNRGDTLIDQDGNYFMEAIRHGAQGLDELTKYVYAINFVVADGQGNITTNPINPIYQYPNYLPRRIIGALSVPYQTTLASDSSHSIIRTEAKVHAISGAAVEKDPNSLIGFDYLLTSEIYPFTAYDPGTVFPMARTNEIGLMGRNLGSSLHEIRLTFRWPYSPVTGNLGSNKKVFRALVSGTAVPTTNDYFFFYPTTFNAD